MNRRHPNAPRMVPNYISISHSTTTAIVLVAVSLLYIVYKKVLRHLSAPIRQLPGPKSANWLTGSLERHVWEPDAQDVQLEWIQKYGPVFRYYGTFNVSAPHVADSNKLDLSIFPDGHDHYYGSPSVEPYP